jgi:23S rRNA (cytidine1920-2'-O)/16S rRNA (cytidine1409-2'-O)-methyltransferase
VSSARPKQRLRLDELLVRRGFYAARSRARDAVLRGTVAVSGVTAMKPGQPVDPDARIEVRDAARSYVSRAALKLAHALEHFEWSPEGLDALDIGASTGGFTQVLLERGARHVTAIDVGHGQLAAHLSDDPRVTTIEGLNARDLSAEHMGSRPRFITADVSFISLKLALPRALDLAPPGARLIALVKPQFEAGREAIHRSGVVRDPTFHERACNDIAAFLVDHDWTVAGIIPAPIEGGDGNKEFLIAAEKPC